MLGQFHIKENVSSTINRFNSYIYSHFPNVFNTICLIYKHFMPFNLRLGTVFKYFTLYFEPVSLCIRFLAHVYQLNLKKFASRGYLFFDFYIPASCTLPLLSHNKPALYRFKKNQHRRNTYFSAPVKKINASNCRLAHN